MQNNHEIDGAPEPELSANQYATELTNKETWMQRDRQGVAPCRAGNQGGGVGGGTRKKSGG